MNTSRHQKLAQRKRHMERRREKVARRRRRIERRLRPRTWRAQATPMYRASNIQYEHSDRMRGLASGGIGAMHRLAQHTGVVEAIDAHVQVLNRPDSYSTSYSTSRGSVNLLEILLGHQLCVLRGPRAIRSRPQIDPSVLRRERTTTDDRTWCASPGVQPNGDRGQ